MLAILPSFKTSPTIIPSCFHSLQQGSTVTMASPGHYGDIAVPSECHWRVKSLAQQCHFIGTIVPR
ncbi:MAG: hypothetical protein LUH15_13745 [Tannerellaceae bacterium]|nr:hypothetical protein [Tannerellaceae bacterium]